MRNGPIQDINIEIGMLIATKTQMMATNTRNSVIRDFVATLS